MEALLRKAEASIGLGDSEEALEQLSSAKTSVDDPASNRGLYIDYLTILGDLKLLQGDLEAAAEQHELALGLFKSEYDSTHPDVARSLERLADVRKQQERFTEASELYRQAAQILEGAPDEYPRAGELQEMAEECLRL